MNINSSEFTELKKTYFPNGQRIFAGPLGVIVTCMCVCLTLWTTYMGFFGETVPFLTRAIYLFFTIPLVFLLFPANRKKYSENATKWDILLFVISMAAFAWAAYSNERYQWRMGYVDDIPLIDFIAGVVAVLSVLEAARRTVGNTITSIACIFLTYTLTGPYWPDIFRHKGLDFERIIEHVYLLPEGLFSMLVGIGATVLFMFLSFGVILQFTGGDKFFMDFATSIAGHRKGGPAKIAVISSAFMGMLSGSSISNVATTGAITIPLMKKTGYSAEDAAAIETGASIGGSITPPLMGAGVFLMTQFTGIPLNTILLYSICPAIVYFAGLYFTADIIARKKNLQGLPKDQIPVLKKVLLQGGHLALPLIVLVVVLVLKFTPFLAVTASTALLLGVSYLRANSRMSFIKLIAAMECATRVTIFISSLLAVAALIFGSISATGLIVKVTSIILSFSGDSLALSLLFVALICCILGMGLPVTAGYVIVATLGSSALTEMGLSLLAAHLIIFWLCQISAMTPPICITAFVAAGIAEANPMITGIKSFIAGKGLYLIPIIFAYGSLLEPSLPEVLFDTLSLLIFMAVVPFAAEGFFVVKLNVIKRLFAAVIAVLFFVACYNSYTIGAIWFGAGVLLLGGFYLVQRANVNSLITTEI